MTGNMLSVFTVYKTLHNWTHAKCPNFVLFQNKEQVHGDFYSKLKLISSVVKLVIY